MLMKIHHTLIITLLLAAGNLLAGTPADSGTAASAAPDKSGYTLFNPTPTALLRDFATDRPNKTNSPRTLDAGHAQVEMDLAAYTYDKESGIRTEDWMAANSNLRLGLTNWAELQLLVPFYENNRVTDTAAGLTQRTEGIGDLTVGVKANFWGNDTGDSAGGIGAYVKTPTASHDIGNGKTEGTLLALLDFSLPADIDLGVNCGVGITANDTGGYHTDIINSACVSHKLVGTLSGYLEFYSSVPSNQSSEWVGTVDVGLTLMVAKNVQLDTGLNIGVTRAADNLETFLGLSARF